MEYPLLLTGTHNNRIRPCPVVFVFKLYTILIRNVCVTLVYNAPIILGSETEHDARTMILSVLQNHGKAIR